MLKLTLADNGNPVYVNASKITFVGVVSSDTYEHAEHADAMAWVEVDNGSEIYVKENALEVNNLFEAEKARSRTKLAAEFRKELSWLK